MILFQLGTIVVGLFSNIMGPRWISNYSNTGDAEKLTRSIKFVSIVILATSLVFFLLLHVFLSEVMENYFQAYYFDGFFDVVGLVYFGVVFFCINCFVDWYFICASRERVLAIISAFSLVLTALGTWFLVANHWPLIGFALLFVCIRGVSLIFTIVAAYKYKACVDVAN